MAFSFLTWGPIRADNQTIVHDRTRSKLASTALLGAVLFVTLGATGDICNMATLLHARQGQPAVRDADGQAMVDLLTRLTDAARELHGKATTPAMPEHCLGEHRAVPAVEFASIPAAEPPRPLARLPQLTSLPPPLA